MNGNGSGGRDGRDGRDGGAAAPTTPGHGHQEQVAQQAQAQPQLVPAPHMMPMQMPPPPPPPMVQAMHQAPQMMMQQGPSQPGPLMPPAPQHQMYAAGPSASYQHQYQYQPLPQPQLYAAGPSQYQSPRVYQFQGACAPFHAAGAVQYSLAMPQQIVSSTPKRKVGRPVGSKNKRKQQPEQDDGEDIPVARKPRSQDEEGPELGERTIKDTEVPAKDEDCCAMCSLYIGNWIYLPCGHYGFCYKCVQEEKEDARTHSRKEMCLACPTTPTNYLRGFRANDDVSWVLDDDDDE